MAWKGKVAKKTLDQGPGQFTLTVDFYDDANPTIMIARRDVVVPIAATLAEIQLLVRAEGVRERAKSNYLAVLDGRIPLDAEITI
jgi:hypothetical protein